MARRPNAKPAPARASSAAWKPPPGMGLRYRSGRWVALPAEPTEPAQPAVDLAPIKLQPVRPADLVLPLAVAGTGAVITWLIWASIIGVLGALLLAAAIARIR